MGLVEERIAHQTRRSNAMSAMEQVLVALRFYATGSIQRVVGDTIAISHPTVSRSVTAVTNALVAVTGNFVKMPVTAHAIRQV